MTDLAEQIREEVAAAVDNDELLLQPHREVLRAPISEPARERVSDLGGSGASRRGLGENPAGRGFYASFTPHGLRFFEPTSRVLAPPRRIPWQALLDPEMQHPWRAKRHR